MSSAKVVSMSVLLLSFIACGPERGRDGVVEELAEQYIAEAIANEAISGYHNASLAISVNDHSIEIECASSGSVAFDEESNWRGVCFTIDSDGCSFDTGNAGSLEIESDATLCGGSELSFETTGGVDTLVAQQELSIEGSVTVTRENGTPRSCDYSLEIGAMEEIDEEGSLWSVELSGEICGRDFDADVEVDLSATVDVEVS